MEMFIIGQNGYQLCLRNMEVHMNKIKMINLNVFVKRAKNQLKFVVDQSMRNQKNIKIYLHNGN